jgi:hypothetical protein
MFIRFPSWYLLRTIGGSYFSSWTMVVPFLGYLILLGSINDLTYSLDLTSLGLGQVAAESSPGFMRMKLTFLGLSLVGFATITFRLSCPGEIAKYRDREHYILEAAKSSFPDEAKRKLQRVRRKVWYQASIEGLDEARAVDIVESNQSTAAKMHSGGTAPSLDRESWLDKNLNALNAVHSAEYEIASYSKLPLRHAIFLVYAIGFILTLYPSLQVFWLVLKDVIAAL